MNELESALIPLQKVIELEENSKDHDLGSINTSIDRFGFLERIIINKTTGHLIAGHGRVRTLQQMKSDGDRPPQGIEVSNGNWLVPADYVQVKKKDEVAASIALNRLVELGGWNEPKLVDNLIAIAGKDGRGLRGTGFDGDELDTLIRMYRPELIETPEDPGAQLDKAEELQKKWQVKRGDIWEISRHRLMCGDSTSEEDVGRLMDGKKADLCFTDPPYNVGKDYGEETNDEREDYLYWSKTWFDLCQSTCIVFTPGTVNLRMWLKNFDAPKWVCIWMKINQLSPSGLQGWNTWEPLLVFGKSPKPVPHDLFNIPVAITKKLGHIVPKTLEAWKAFLSAFSIADSLVYDPFLGSGTTMVSCEMLGRICRGMEIEPKYCAVTLERMSGMELTPKLLRK